MQQLVVLIESPDHISYRYRWEAFRGALQTAGWELTSQVLARPVRERMKQFYRLRSADAVVLARRLLPRWQVRVLRYAARRLIFDFDDAVFLRDSYAGRPFHCKRRWRRFCAISRSCDVMIAGNEFLADHAIRAGAVNSAVRVIPTVIETSRYSHCRDAEKPTTASVQLTWIGSSSTAQCFQQARSIFDGIGQRVPRSSLRVISDNTPSFDLLPVTSVPWSEATEARDLAAGDIGVSWIPDDPWSRGKCGLKVLQYFAAGLPVVANRVGVQTSLIDESSAGFLADTFDEWCEAVAMLAGDARLRADLGARGRRFVANHFSVDTWSNPLLEALQANCSGGNTYRHRYRLGAAA